MAERDTQNGIAGAAMGIIALMLLMFAIVFFVDKVLRTDDRLAPQPSAWRR